MTDTSHMNPSQIQGQGQTTDSAKGTFKGWHLLAIMIGFFSVIIAVNFTMATLASKSWTGLIVKNGYVASQDFNKFQEAARVQKTLGWQSQLTYLDKAIRFNLLDRNGLPVKLDAARVSVGLPAHETFDHDVELMYLGDGKYVGQTDLAPGEWALVLTGNKGDQPYRLETRVRVVEDTNRTVRKVD